MPAALSSLQSRRTALAQARRDCDALVTAVEHVVVGWAPDHFDFYAEFGAQADRLLNALQSLNMPLGVHFAYFCDFVVRERGFTALGLPVDQDEWGTPSLDVALTRTWLGHMRELSDSLGEHKPRRSGPSQKRGGGRQKDPAVLRLESQVAAVYQGERESLVKNGMTRPEARRRLATLTATDLLRRINEDNDHPYPLRGPEADRLKKQVTRSPAYRRYREPEWEESPGDEPEMLLPRDAAYALENGLRPRRAGQN
jgi:hypothetical protein